MGLQNKVAVKIKTTQPENENATNLYYCSDCLKWYMYDRSIDNGCPSCGKNGLPITNESISTALIAIIESIVTQYAPAISKWGNIFKIFSNDIKRYIKSVLICIFEEHIKVKVNIDYKLPFIKTIKNIINHRSKHINVFVVSAMIDNKIVYNYVFNTYDFLTWSVVNSYEILDDKE